MSLKRLASDKMINKLGTEKRLLDKRPLITFPELAGVSVHNHADRPRWRNRQFSTNIPTGLLNCKPLEER